MKRSATKFMQLTGALTGWKHAFSWMRIPRRSTDTVGNMLDFRRVGGAGARIASTAVSHHLASPQETPHAPGRTP